MHVSSVKKDSIIKKLIQTGTVTKQKINKISTELCDLRTSGWRSLSLSYMMNSFLRVKNNNTYCNFALYNLAE